MFPNGLFYMYLYVFLWHRKMVVLGPVPEKCFEVTPFKTSGNSLCRKDAFVFIIGFRTKKDNRVPLNLTLSNFEH